MHSELDADRLDYLLRDSAFTGLSYGHIDLDYIISRLRVVPDKNGVDCLCVERKGIHTVEHYILARFFLQTQVIYNRKVRMVDILFEDVMEYMVSTNVKACRILNLEEFLSHIKGDERKDLHEIYAYTDDQIFIKMRKLHENLDRKQKRGKASKKEQYINTCVKMIMDGQIPEPVVTAQKLIKVERHESKGYESERRSIEDSAKEIAKQAAKGLKLYPSKIKVNVVSQPVMKYSDVRDIHGQLDEESNREAVRFFYKDSSTNEKKMKPAVKSNASVLGGLIDKELLILNVFYVEPLRAHNEQQRKNIRDFFASFISKHFQTEKKGCGCPTGLHMHMCQMFLEQPDWASIKKLVKNAKYMCKRCGRVSSCQNNLCVPAEI